MDSSLHGLEVSSENVDCCALVTLRGDVDVATAPLVQSHIEALTRMPTEHLLFDCEGLDFIDSSGIHVLEDARQAFGASLGLVRPQKPIQRLLEIVGLSLEYPDFDTIEEARDYFHSGGERRFSAGA